MVPLDEEKGSYLASFGGAPSPLTPASEAGASQEPSAECFEEGIARVMFRSILAALKECHEKGIAHRDVKPENVVASADGRVRLTDFSSCYLFSRPARAASPSAAKDALLVQAIEALITGDDPADQHIAAEIAAAAHPAGRGSVSDRQIRQLHAKEHPS